MQSDSAATVEVAGAGARFTQHGDDVILRAALRAGFGFPYECNAGSCGCCKFELLEGEVEVLDAAAPGLSPRDRSRHRFLACQTRAKGPCRIRVNEDEAARPVHAPLRRRAVLKSRRALTHDLSEFEFQADAPARFIPGQYVTLERDRLRRSYSMCGLPNDDGIWAIQAKRMPNGKFSAALFDELAIGATVTLDGPYGLAHLRADATEDIVCIAGGSGLGPMLSVARGAVAAGLEGRCLHFFYGGRRPRDLAGHGEVEALAGFGRQVFYYPVVSDPQPDDAWSGLTGYVHHAVSRVLGDALRDCRIYVAGSPQMVEAALVDLQQRGSVPGERIHFDRFF